MALVVLGYSGELPLAIKVGLVLCIGDSFYEAGDDGVNSFIKP